jgi:acetyltransferase-like isoleucine patch superfamily enzyme
MIKAYRLFRYDWPLHFILVLSNWWPDNVALMRLRGYLISPFFHKCGKDLRVGRNNVFVDSYLIEIGDNVYIAYGNWFNGSGGLYIGDEILFGPKSVIVTSNHTRKSGSFRYGATQVKPIHIKSGSWIGGNCAVLAGSVIGEGSLIAANTVVNGAVPDNVMFAGNPGKVKKDICE